MKKILPGILFYLCVQLSFADSQITENRSETVVVTATRTTQTVDESLVSVTVITQEDIERQQATSIQELLRAVAGISIANFGGEGKVTSLYLRGTESDHVLVLVNGVKIGSATAGSAALHLIPVSQIEKIEIVRGPHSSLYGSEAIGGVVQIFTKTGKGPVLPYANVSYGTYDTRRSQVGVSGSNNKSWFNVSVGAIDTDGFDVCRGNLSAGCFADDPDKDGYREISGNIVAGHKISPSTNVNLNWMRADGSNKYDSSAGYPNESDTVQEVVGVNLIQLMGGIGQLSLSAGQSKDKSDDFENGIDSSFFYTTRRVSSIQSDFVIDSNKELIAGYDYQKEEVDSTEDYSETSRKNDGLFLQYLQDTGVHKWQVSARYDDNEQFGSHNTGSIIWGTSISEKVNLSVSYGTAYKAPSFNELYWPASIYWSGNPDLDPEESESMEIGVRRQMGWGSWAVNIYRTNFDNLIASDYTINAPANLDSAVIRGIEFRLLANVNGWTTNTDVTILDPENRATGSNYGNDLPLRPRQEIRIEVRRDFHKYQLGTVLLAIGKRYNDIANTETLESYQTADINLGYKLSSELKVSASLKNIFDKEYETVAYYNQPGRNFLLTLSYEPLK